MSKTTTSDESVISIDRSLAKKHTKVVLSGKQLSLSECISITDDSVQIQITNDKKVRERMIKSHQVMIDDIKHGKPVYGSNSGFGGQAGRVVSAGDAERKLQSARRISDGLAFLDVGVGEELPTGLVRMAMAIRINMLLQGVSAVRTETLDVFVRMLNAGITPIVNEHGGIGASGDLIHNQRIVSAARGLSGVKVMTKDGKKRSAKLALRDAGISPLQLAPKEGLGLVNGDNFSSAYAAHVYKHVIEHMLLNTILGAMVVEVLHGSTRSFHPVLSKIRPHPGQDESSRMYRYLLEGSGLAYQELSGHKVREEGVKVQDGYSLRCLSQFEGIMIEQLRWIGDVLRRNVNAVSDNPVWVPPEYVTKNERPWQWVSGGNFLAMHMAEALDIMRKCITKMIKRNDRHLARLIDVTENNGLPANLSHTRSITQCTFKGVQIQMGMYDVYSTILAIPVTTLFGTHEERNQDITSHATTSGVLAMKALQVLRYSCASNLLAVCQAVDLREGVMRLSPKTRRVYDAVRKISKTVTKERPLYPDIEKVAVFIESGEMANILRKEVFA